MLSSLLQRLFLLSLLFTLTATAQIELGLMALANSTFLDGQFRDSERIGDTARLSFGIGGILTVRFSENIAINVQPAITEKGGKNGAPGNFSEEIRLTFLDVPTFIRLRMKRTYLLLGGYYARLVTADYIRTHEEQRTGIEQELSDGDSGIAIGAGVEIPTATREKFLLELQYSRSAGNLLNTAIDNQHRLKHRGLSLKLGFVF